MPFRDQATGAYPVSHEQIRRANPNVSFPAYFEAFDGYDWVMPTTPPAITENQYLEEGPPVLGAGGWEQTWVVKDFDPSVISARQAAQIASEAALAREYRKRLLIESDWTQLADSSGDKTAWAVYRQALRDISSQSGFPKSIIWPTDPNGVTPSGPNVGGPNARTQSR